MYRDLTGKILVRLLMGGSCLREVVTYGISTVSKQAKMDKGAKHRLMRNESCRPGLSYSKL